MVVIVVIVVLIVTIVIVVIIVVIIVPPFLHSLLTKGKVLGQTGSGAKAWGRWGCKVWFSE